MKQSLDLTPSTQILSRLENLPQELLFLIFHELDHPCKPQKISYYDTPSISAYLDIWRCLISQISLALTSKHLLATALYVNIREFYMAHSPSDLCRLISTHAGGPSTFNSKALIPTRGTKLCDSCHRRWFMGGCHSEIKNWLLRGRGWDSDVGAWYTSCRGSMDVWAQAAETCDSSRGKEFLEAWPRYHSVKRQLLEWIEPSQLGEDEGPRLRRPTKK